MKIRIELVFISLFTLLSCSDANNSSIISLEKSWKLSRVYGGLQGVDFNYGSYNVIWTFSEKTVEIQNDILTTGPEQIHSGFTQGIYNYEIIQENSEEHLYIDNLDQGKLILTNNSLMLDDCIACDGFIKEFNLN